jgi:hypothetical protein
MKEYGIYVDTCGEGATYFLLRTKESQRDLAPQDRAPILHTFCSFVEILYVQNNLVCYGLGMRQPAHGCNVRAKRLTHFILTFLS